MSVSGAGHEDEHDRRLGEAIDGYMERWARGEPVAMEEWVARFPDLADELRECLAALPLLQHVPAPGPAAASRPPGAPGYEVLEEIGRGGMGVVHRAVQTATKRTVALKFLATGQLASPAARLRFAREVELAAALDHPGIVRVLEAGDAPSGLYCAMELVLGEPLHVYLARRQASIRDKLELFMRIVDAVHYAHQRGVVHRDLKPGNITVVDEGPQPKILDFGLARFTPPGESDFELTQMTQEGQLVGTLPYLSPEQAAGAAREVETRSDLYALGVILYEMLTRRLPYDTSGPLDAALHQIRYTIPSRPSQFCREVSGDLDTVVLKALEKPKEARYQTAAEFGEDLRCCLRGEPPEANRSTRFYLLRKAYARHRRQVLGGAAAIGTLIVVSAAILALYLQVLQERDRLNEQLHVTRLQRGLAHLAAGHDSLAEILLRSAYRQHPGDLRAYWSLLSFYIQNPLLHRVSHAGWVTTVSYSPDGSIIAYGDNQGIVSIRDADTFQLLRSMQAHHGGISSLQFAAGGQVVVTGGADGRIRLWSTSSGDLLRELNAHDGGVTRVRVAAAGKRFLSAGNDGKVLLWNVSGDDPPWTVVTSNGRLPILAADLSADGTHVAVATDGLVRILDTANGQVRAELTEFPNTVQALRFSPDGGMLAVWSNAEISVWDALQAERGWSADAGLAEPRPTSLWDQHPEPHWSWTPSLEFSDDDALLAVGGWDAVVRLWNPCTGEPRGALRAHGTAVYALSFQGGTRALATGEVKQLQVWDLEYHAATLSQTSRLPGEHTCVAVSDRAGLMAWAEARSGSVAGISMMRLAPPHSVTTWEAPLSGIEAMAFDPSGRRLATVDDGGNSSLWDIETRQCVHAWRMPGAHPHRLAFSRDTARVACGGVDGDVRIWNCTDGTRETSWNAHRGPVLALAFSPDGRRLISGGADFQARLWEIGRPQPLATWNHIEWVNAAAFSRDGTRMATGSADKGLRIGRVGEQPDGGIRGRHAHWITAVAFVDGGRLVVTAGNDSAVRIWDAQTGQREGEELAALPSMDGPVRGLAVSDDERFLAIGTARTVRLIDLGRAQEMIRRDISAAPGQ